MVKTATTQPAQIKGALLTLASAACVAVTYVTSKQVMQNLSPLAFTPIWFGVASLWGVGFYLLRNGVKTPPGLSRTIWPILGLGFFNGLANLLFFIAVNLGNPTLVAFFSRSETVYTVLLGALLLGERMRRYQWAGAILAVFGAGVMTFRAGPVVWLMLALLLVSSFFLSASTLLAKKYILAVEPLVLSTARTVIMAVLLAGVGLAAKQWTWPSGAAWLWIIGGSFFGPFLSYVLFYRGLRYFDLGQGAVIRSTQPLFVAVYSLILFGVFITAQQWLGGLMMLAGVALMLWPRRKAGPSKICYWRN
ncbi:MAG: DMT family transporter [Anaerolineae bacterium]|nr:DMT family transporter [Anaerolineae bacterium]